MGWGALCALIEVNARDWTRWCIGEQRFMEVSLPLRRRREGSDGMGRAFAVATPIRLHHRLSYHLPGIHDRPCVLSGGPGSAVALHQTRRIQESLPVLGEDLCLVVRHGRRVGRGDELPVRHELERV